MVPIGIEDAKPAPGVLEAITDADVVLVPPSNPVVSVGTILGVPGIRDALRDDRGSRRRASPGSSARTTSAAWPGSCSG